MTIGFSCHSKERQYYISLYPKGIGGIIAQWLKDDGKEAIAQMIEIIENCILSRPRE